MSDSATRSKRILWLPGISLAVLSVVFGLLFSPGIARAAATGADFMIVWQSGCSAPPAEAVAAMEYAAGIWGAALASPVPIEVSACWTSSLPCDGIACGDSAAQLRNFSAAPMADTYYPVALASALAGIDLTPGQPDINVWFDAAQNWSFITSGEPGAGIDFVSVAMHEIAHGLGFTGNLYESYNVGFCGNGPYSWYPCPMVYDRFLVDSQGIALLSYLPLDSFALGTRLKSDSNFGGPNTLTRAGAARLYTPPIWEQGASLSHLDPGTFSSPNTLMLPSYQGGVRAPGPVVMAILQDMGWSPAGSEPNLTSSGPAAVAVGSEAALQTHLTWSNYTGQPVEYTWATADQAPITHAGGGSDDSAALRWDTSGFKMVTITATGQDLAVSATRSVLVFSLTANGPTRGIPGRAYTFQATLFPDTALPVTYQWQATGQPTITRPDLGASDTLPMTWSLPGVKTITVTASIGAASTQATYTFQVTGNVLYLPSVTRPVPSQ